MDNRPIGVFDSGVGGLTTVRYLMKELPEERIVFFGDTARTPYGSKTVETISAFASQICDFLVKEDVKMIVIACNTVTSVCLPELQKRYPNIPIIGAISPTVKALNAIVSSNMQNVEVKIQGEVCLNQNRVGIIATKVTTQSGQYEKEIRELSLKNMDIHSMACPLLVPMIEEGIVDGEIMNLTLKHYLEEFLNEHRINTMVLGCTHYPLVSNSISSLYPNLQLVSSSEEIAKDIIRNLHENDMLALKKEREDVFYISDISEIFVHMIQNILKKNAQDINIVTKNLEMEN